MITFDNVWKSFRVPGGTRKDIVRGLTLTLPNDRHVAVIGRNGAGKSTLLRIISGAVLPDKGRVFREGRFSWPLGFSGGLHPALTGRQNARFIARVYGADTDLIVEAVEEFAELGQFFDAPMITYSSGMRARLSFGISLACDFDCYIIDEATAVGDAAFKAKARKAIRAKLATGQIILVSHSEGTLRDYCNCALWLEGGDAWFFDDLEEGLTAYREAGKRVSA